MKKILVSVMTLFLIASGVQAEPQKMRIILGEIQGFSQEELVWKEQEAESPEPLSLFNQTLKEEEERFPEKEAQRTEHTNTLEIPLNATGVQEIWQEQSDKRLGSSVELVSFVSWLDYLDEKKSEVPWRQLWIESPDRFWIESSAYMVGFAEGYITGVIETCGVTSVYVRPEVRSVRIQEGGTYDPETRAYRPNYVYRTYETDGFYMDAWEIKGTISLYNAQGIRIWKNDENFVQPKKERFSSISESRAFASYFSDRLKELPLKELKNQ